ncbi:hypothetical protein ACFQ5C_19690, partial [Methylobacterium goesingense]
AAARAAAAGREGSARGRAARWVARRDERKVERIVGLRECRPVGAGPVVATGKRREIGQNRYGGLAAQPWLFGAGAALGTPRRREIPSDPASALRRAR